MNFPEYRKDCTCLLIPSKGRQELHWADCVDDEPYLKILVHKFGRQHNAIILYCYN